MHVWFRRANDVRSLQGRCNVGLFAIDGEQFFEKTFTASGHLAEYKARETMFKHYQFVCQLCNDYLIFDEKDNWDRHCNFKARNQNLVVFSLYHIVHVKPIVQNFWSRRKGFDFELCFKQINSWIFFNFIYLNMSATNSPAEQKFCWLSDRSKSLFDNRSQIFL